MSYLNSEDSFPSFVISIHLEFCHFFLANVPCVIDFFPRELQWKMTTNLLKPAPIALTLIPISLYINTPMEKPTAPGPTWRHWPLATSLSWPEKRTFTILPRLQAFWQTSPVLWLVGRQCLSTARSTIYHQICGVCTNCFENLSNGPAFGFLLLGLKLALCVPLVLLIVSLRSWS